MGQLLPALSRFYGPHEWMAMPYPLLNAYVVMLPRLQAREYLERITVAAIGAGTMDKHERRRAVAAWSRQAQAGAEGQRAAALPPEQRRAILASMGIGVRTVPRGQ